MWVCDYCEKEHKDNILQCSCGKWKNPEAKEKYWQGSSVKKCYAALESTFEFPTEPIITSSPMERKDYSDYGYKSFNQKKEIIKKYTDWLLSYYKVGRSEIIVNIYEKKDSSNKQGQYSSKGYYGYKTIDIGVSGCHKLETDLYIATHEVMHAFLDKHGIRMNNKTENEMLADIACYYFGLGDFIRKGSNVSWVESKSYVLFEEVTRHNTTYGYLSEDNKALTESLYRKRLKQLETRRSILQGEIKELEKNNKKIKKLFKKTLKYKSMNVKQQRVMGELSVEKENIEKSVDNIIQSKSKIVEFKTKKEFDDYNGFIKEELNKLIELKESLKEIVKK